MMILRVNSVKFEISYHNYSCMTDFFFYFVQPNDSYQYSRNM